MASPDGFKTAAVLRGIAAMDEMLDQIGGDPDEADDKIVAKIMCDNEMDIRTAIRFAIANVSL